MTASHLTALNGFGNPISIGDVLNHEGYGNLGVGRVVSGGDRRVTLRFKDGSRKTVAGRNCFPIGDQWRAAFEAAEVVPA